MAKLYFRYGTVSSAKSLTLLSVVHNYSQKKQKALLLKPRLDTRFGQDTVRSRAGLEKTADLLVDETSHLNFDMSLLLGVACIIVDECQFLSRNFVEFLRQVTVIQQIPVICYGLRTDFRGELFEGSKRLLELADTIEEVKTVCTFCTRKATMNLKSIDGVPTVSGPQVQLGAEETYQPVCFAHYHQQLKNAKTSIDHKSHGGKTI